MEVLTIMSKNYHQQNKHQHQQKANFEAPVNSIFKQEVIDKEVDLEETNESEIECAPPEIHADLSFVPETEIEQEVKNKVEPKPETPVAHKIFNCERVNFRKEPSFNSEVICIINKGEEVKLINQGNDFLEVEYKNQIGYCHKDYVSK